MDVQGFVRVTAKIIQFVPKPNPNRVAGTLEQQAIGLVGFLNGLTAIDEEPNVIVGHPSTVRQANSFHNIGQGIDGMTFTAPDKDSA